jgi:hypothetical protein
MDNVAVNLHNAWKHLQSPLRKLLVGGAGSVGRRAKLRGSPVLWLFRGWLPATSKISSLASRAARFDSSRSRVDDRAAADDDVDGQRRAVSSGQADGWQASPLRQFVLEQRASSCRC